MDSQNSKQGTIVRSYNLDTQKNLLDTIFQTGCLVEPLNSWWKATEDWDSTLNWTHPWTEHWIGFTSHFNLREFDCTALEGIKKNLNFSSYKDITHIIKWFLKFYYWIHALLPWHIYDTGLLKQELQHGAIQFEKLITRISLHTVLATFVMNHILGRHVLKRKSPLCFWKHPEPLHEMTLLRNS